MKTYCVSFSGSVDIDAENEKEAEQKFNEISDISKPINNTDILECIQVDEISGYESVD